MNFKSKATGLAVILTIAICLSMIIASATPGPKGPYVDEFMWTVIKSPTAQLIALTTHDIDCGGVPDPSDIPTLKAAGFSIHSAVALGYNMLFTNNLLYPCDDLAMREALIRLIDKAELDELYYPVSRHIEYWLPESQAAYVNPAAKLPLYDPATANQILNDAGYRYCDGLEGRPLVPSPAGWQDPDVPGSQAYYRLDPGTGQRMADIEYVTRPMEESPLYYEQSVINTERFHAMGIPVVLTPKSWEFIVPILVNSDPLDYQMLTGVGIVWGSPAPDILYDFLESSCFPLWNVWNFNNATADYWCAQMKATLDPAVMVTAAYKLQEICNEQIPYIPVMTYLSFTTHAGAYDTNPGCIKIVNAAGFGAIASYNEHAKEFGESRRIVGGDQLYKSYLGGEIDNLNPLMCNTVPGWQPLDAIMGDFIRLNAYTHEYMFRAIEGLPTMAEWTGPNEEVGMTLEYTLRDNVKWQDGVPVTAADCVFALNLMRFQQNERYYSSWEPIYDVKQTGTYSFKIWYLQRYCFAHEYFGMSLLCPKHIWETFVDDPEGSLVISEGTGPMGGDVWTSVGRHHSEFDPWEVAHPTVPGLTCLIGTDNFLFGHWEEKVSCSVVAWKDEDNYMNQINPADCTIDGLVDMLDVWQVLYRQGDFRMMCYPVSIGGHPRWDTRADIADVAQIIDGKEIFEVTANFGLRWWPPEEM